MRMPCIASVQTHKNASWAWRLGGKGIGEGRADSNAPLQPVKQACEVGLKPFYFNSSFEPDRYSHEMESKTETETKHVGMKGECVIGVFINSARGQRVGTHE